MRFFIGLDIGGTKCAAVVGDPEGRVLTRAFSATPKSAVEWEAVLVDLVRRAARAAGVDPERAEAFGVSYGGPVSAAGMALPSPNLRGWNGFDLSGYLAHCFPVPLRILNDANATALAEHRWGAGLGCSNLVFLTVGTGIGAGILIDGRLYVGRDGLAGEIGHIVLQPGGPECACGKRGCLQALASGSAVGQAGRVRFGDRAIDGVAVVERARQGDPAAREILSDAGRWLGVGISMVLQTLNPDRIILGTLAVEAYEFIVPAMKEVIAADTWPEIAAGVDIVPAGLGHESQDRAALAAAQYDMSCQAPL